MRSTFTPELSEFERAAAGEVVYKFGFNTAVGTTEEGILSQGGVFLYPAAATTMTISSSAGADDVGSTGATSVQIYGLDANYLEQTETLAMDGQTEVVTAEYIRVFRAIVRAAGSGETNAGTIHIGEGTVTAGVPATSYLQIGIGDGQTLHTAYTIPANKTAYLTQLLMSTGGNANTVVTGRMCIREFGEIFTVKDHFLFTRTAPINPIHRIPIKVPAKADIEVRGTASTGTTDVSAAFGLVFL